MSKHTPGPWRIVTDRFGDSEHIRAAHSNQTVASFLTSVKRSCGPDLTEANTRLIATAPELLTWAKWAAKHLTDEAKNSGQFEMMQAAIAKATGAAA